MHKDNQLYFESKVVQLKFITMDNKTKNESERRDTREYVVFFGTKQKIWKRNEYDFLFSLILNVNRTDLTRKRIILLHFWLFSCSFGLFSVIPLCITFGLMPLFRFYFSISYFFQFSCIWIDFTESHYFDIIDCFPFEWKERSCVVRWSDDTKFTIDFSILFFSIFHFIRFYFIFLGRSQVVIS